MGGEVLRHPPNREIFDGKGKEAWTAKGEMPTSAVGNLQRRAAHVRRIVALIAVGFACFL